MDVYLQLWVSSLFFFLWNPSSLHYKCGPHHFWFEKELRDTGHTIHFIYNALNVDISYFHQNRNLRTKTYRKELYPNRDCFMVHLLKITKHILTFQGALIKQSEKNRLNIFFQLSFLKPQIKDSYNGTWPIFLLGAWYSNYVRWFHYFFYSLYILRQGHYFKSNVRKQFVYTICSHTLNVILRCLCFVF